MDATETKILDDKMESSTITRFLDSADQTIATCSSKEFPSIIRLSDVAKYLKGTSGLLSSGFFRSYSRDSVKGGIWSRSYYGGTAGVSSEVIKRYIERVEHD